MHVSICDFSSLIVLYLDCHGSTTRMCSFTKGATVLISLRLLFRLPLLLTHLIRL